MMLPTSPYYRAGFVDQPMRWGGRVIVPMTTLALGSPYLLPLSDAVAMMDLINVLLSLLPLIYVCFPLSPLPRKLGRRKKHLASG